MQRRQSLGRAALAAVLLSLILVVAAAAPGAGGKAAKRPQAVQTKSDAARAKLDTKLQKLVAKGSTKRVFVYATVKPGAAADAAALMQNGHVAAAGDISMVIGSVRANEATKLAGAAGVMSVKLVELKQTGSPLGIPEPNVNQRPSASSLESSMNDLRQQEVPYSDAPAPKSGNFESLRQLGVLDAKTHKFADAWNQGFAGEGTTVSILDGGTDWTHPDLLNTWQTWSGATDSTFTDNGWNGWPKAFDPYDTLVWLLAPSFVDQGLTWYTPTVAKSSFTQNAQDKKANLLRVSFATRVGPSRNFSAPDATVSHSYTFPKGWTKSGTVRMGSHPDDYLLQLFGERPAILVTDPNTAGVYDTVYVDLDDDYQFADEKPVTKSSPASYRDMNGDGYNDLSGGLLYYISDGETVLPGGVMRFTDGSAEYRDSFTFGPGEMLAWTGDYDPGIEGHGTLTASNILGQGVVNGLAPCFADLAGRPGAQPCPGGGTYPGAVIGGAPKAKGAPFGDIYFSFDFSTQFGYLLATRHGIDVTSNSYGSSTADNDGYDAASQEADLLYSGSRTTPLFSTGNGAPGFGTATAPQPLAGIATGASTQFGGTGWDSIKNESQIVDNDVMVWSNRGPQATGGNGVDVVADGAFSPGDKTLNTALDGRVAWETWGGTSRSTPVAVAATALVYQAWRQAHGGAIPAGFYTTAKQILKSSSQDLGYESWIQGSGSVDAGRAVKVASGTDAYVSPDNWRPGNYRGTEYPVFTRMLSPGGSDSQTFTVNGPGTWTASDRYMKRTASQSMSFTSSNRNKESTYNFNAPDYLLDLTSLVQSHSDADLMVVRANFPRNEFDANGDYTADQAWRLLTYDWTDVNHDGNLWTDADDDGVVDHTVLGTSSHIDGDLDLNFAASEMDKGEYVRFMYHRAGSNALQSFVRNPADRMADGIFLGLQHSARTKGIPVTHFKIRVDFYDNVDWPWVTTTAVSGGTFTATMNVPADAPYGMYDGAVVLTNGGEDIVVPVSLTVGATATQDASGKLTGQLHFGGADTADDQQDLLFNNGSFFGANDWTWREESGDWRFFYLDVPATPAQGSVFLSDTTWDDAAPYTDLDTLLFGRSANSYQLLGGSAPFGGPYIVDTLGASARAYLGSGTWAFNTATGGAEDVVTAPAQAGLNAVVQHGVSYDGGRFDVPFETTLGSAVVNPTQVEQSVSGDSGSFDVTFESTVDLSGLGAEGFGLSQPVTSTETAHQDNPDDPSTASVKKTFTISHASRATFEVHLPSNDIDLYVLKGGQVVGSSTTASGDESVTLIRPPDGTYEVWVHGFSVTGTPTFPLTFDAVQGNDLSVSGIPSGAVPAGTPVTLHVDFSKSMTSGQDYFGEILLGPSSAPTAIHVPVTIHRN